MTESALQSAPTGRARFASAWSDLAGVGRDHRRGGYSRHVFDDADMQLRSWFTEQAQRRGLDVEIDRNGNVWAWWGAPGPDAVVTGSHLDSVPGGGAFDGPLGVVSGAAGRRRAAGARRDAGPAAGASPASPRRRAAGSACPAWVLGC